MKFVLIHKKYKEYFFSVILKLISAIFLWQLFSESWWTQSEQDKNDHFGRGCRWFHLYFIGMSKVKMYIRNVSQWVSDCCLTPTQQYKEGGIIFMKIQVKKIEIVLDKKNNVLFSIFSHQLEVLLDDNTTTRRNRARKYISHVIT